MEFEREAAGTVKRVVRTAGHRAGLDRRPRTVPDDAVPGDQDRLAPDRRLNQGSGQGPTIWQGVPVARPSIVPIALTLDDRTGYTLWAPPWEEDGEEWQAFLGTTEDDTATVHLFPTPAALAAFCRTQHRSRPRRPSGVAGRAGARRRRPHPRRRPPLRPRRRLRHRRREPRPLGRGGARRDDRHRQPARRVPRHTAEPDEELDDAETEGQFEAVAELAAKPEIGSLGLGVEAFVGRSGEDAWIGVGGVLDDLWEDVVEELSEHLDWTGAGTRDVDDYPPASEVEERRRRRRLTPRSRRRRGAVDDDEPGRAHHRPRRPDHRLPGRGRPRPRKFWETVGILPVEVVVPEGAGVTLRCYVDDVARFLGRNGEVYVFDTPADLARFVKGNEDHDLIEIASWAGGRRHRRPAAAGRPGPLRPHRAVRGPRRGRRRRGRTGRPPGLRRSRSRASATSRSTPGSPASRSCSAPSSALGREIARGRAGARRDAAGRGRRASSGAQWDEVVTLVSGALVFRD